MGRTGPRNCVFVSTFLPKVTFCVFDVPLIHLCLIFILFFCCRSSEVCEKIRETLKFYHSFFFEKTIIFEDKNPSQSQQQRILSEVLVAQRRRENCRPTFVPRFFSVRQGLNPLLTSSPWRPSSRLGPEIWTSIGENLDYIPIASPNRFFTKQEVVTLLVKWKHPCNQSRVFNYNTCQNVVVMNHVLSKNHKCLGWRWRFTFVFA